MKDVYESLRAASWFEVNLTSDDSILREKDRATGLCQGFVRFGLTPRNLHPTGRRS